MKLFSAGLMHETNVYSPLPTGVQNYEKSGLWRGGVPEENPTHVTQPIVIWKQRARERGWTLVESLCTYTEPSGRTSRPVYEGFREEILSDLRAALPVDGVLLRLHGAMQAQDYDDCEGDLIQRVRSLVGPDVPVMAELDPHAHLTATMLEHATALVFYKEYPHTDIGERAEDLWRLMADTVTGKVRPVMSAFDCQMIEVFFTTVEPMKGFVARMSALEGQGKVLSVSCVHGFAKGDLPELGAKMLVVTDAAAEQGAALAKELGMELIGLRGKTRTPLLSIAETVRRMQEASAGPLVIADGCDNPGGGAPGDSVWLLRAVLEAGVRGVLFACLWDPIAVQQCFAAGEGARLKLRVGGKMAPSSGEPVDLEVTVTGLKRELMQRFGSAWNRLGDAAAVRATDGSVDLVLVSHRSQTFGLEPVTELGLDPAAFRAIAVKSTNHFRAAYEPIAAEILYVETPSALPSDPRTIPYTKVPTERLWPFTENPWPHLRD